MVATTVQIRRIVQNFVRVAEPIIQVERVILYGSYASNEATEWSDIDIAIVSPSFRKLSNRQVVNLLARAIVKCDNRLMPMAYTPAEFDSALPYMFAAEIKRTGKVIYDVRRKPIRKRRTMKVKRKPVRT
jgi:predicted nucleotidyltransferase